MSTEHESIKVNGIRKAVESCLEDSSVSLHDFFKQIVEGDYDLIVFVSRRCYILFQMFAMIENWSYDNICTDLGIYMNRKKLMSCSSVIVVDDIGYTGNSIRKVLRQIRGYVPKSCKVIAALYAVNRGTADKVLNAGKFFGKEQIKCRFQFTSRKCFEISVQFVAAILAAGVPYTTFVYPIWGKVSRQINNDYTLLPSKNKMNLFKRYKWKTSYLNLEDVEKVSYISSISDCSCVRIYKDCQSKEIEYFLPFIFLKGVKADKVDVWSKCIAKIFSDLGREELAQEIEEAINEGKKNRKDALEYIACIVVCLCTKALSEVLDLSQYLRIQEEGIYEGLKGSFSSTVLSTLKTCDTEFASLFLGRLSDEAGDGDGYYQEDKEHRGTETEYIKKYVLENCMELDVYETTYEIFKWLKSNKSDQYFGRTESKAIYVDDMVSVLKEVRGFNLKDIYLAQMECWDIGIATYRLVYDAQRGIVGRCSAGEMSAVVPALKYQELIRRYFTEKLKIDFWEDNDKKQNEILEIVLNNACEEGKYTEKELAEFREIVKERRGSLYGMLI